MSEDGDFEAADALPAVSGRNRMRLPLIWLVPILAAIIGGWIAVRAILDHGHFIVVTFIDADGIEAGKTKVRYKNVDLGDVRKITLAADHRTVNVSIEMARFADPFLVDGTRFWVVRPRLGASGVSGLGTLLSGAFIAMDVGTSHDYVRNFTGLEVPPAITGDSAGKQFVLEAADLGSLSVGAPAYFHHIQVGQIIALALNDDGRGVTLKLFIQSPYDRFVTSDTRFWHASGVDVAVDAGGVHMQTESLTTILAGGVALEAPPGSTAVSPVPSESHFKLVASRESAMKAPDGAVETFVLYFDESLRGLAPGAAVDFRGVEIGEVTSLKVEYDRGTDKFLFPVLVNIYPERVRSRYRKGSNHPQASSYDLVASMIEHGYRAQLRTASLLTGQLYIALDYFPHSAKLVAQPTQAPMPLPTIPGNLAELQNSIVSVAHKLDQFPLDKIGHDLDHVLGSLNITLASANAMIGKVDKEIVPEAQSTLAQAKVTLAQTQNALGPDTSLQTDLHATLSSVSRAADSVRVLVDYLDKHPEALIRGKVQEKP